MMVKLTGDGKDRTFGGAEFCNAIFAANGEAGPRSAALEQQLVCLGATHRRFLPGLLTTVTVTNHASVVPINRRSKRAVAREKTRESGVIRE